MALKKELTRPGSPDPVIFSKNLKEYASYKQYVPFIENGKKREKNFCDECSFKFTFNNIRIEIDKEKIPFTKHKCDHCSSIKRSLFYKMYVLHRRTMCEIGKIIWSYYYDDIHFPKYIIIQKKMREYLIRKKKAKNTAISALNNYLLRADLHENEFDKEKFEIYDSTDCELDSLSRTP